MLENINTWIILYNIGFLLGITLFISGIYSLIVNKKENGDKKFSIFCVIMGLIFSLFIIPAFSIILQNKYIIHMVYTSKPVIYLYPEEEINTEVVIDYNGKFTCTYPDSEGTWLVAAYPDGTLKINNREYNYLYYEGIADLKENFDTGFCVKKEDSIEFLEEKLAILGLTEKESNDFITYWLPRLYKNEYNLISFDTTSFEEISKLKVNPVPDTTIRVYMTFKGIDNPIYIEEQELISIDRQGFTVVEWGGSEIEWKKEDLIKNRQDLLDQICLTKWHWT